MPRSLAPMFDEAERLAAPGTGAPIILCCSGFSFHLLQSGRIAQTREGTPLRSPQPLNAEFEYFPFGDPSERCFTALRAWLPQNPATAEDPAFAAILRGHFRIRRRGPRPSRQQRIIRHAVYTFETLHHGFDHLAISLDPERAYQRGTATGAPAGSTIPTLLVVEFAIEGIRTELTESALTAM